MEQFGEFVTNHWLLFAALVVITVMLVSNLTSSIGAAGRQLNPSQAVRLINREGAVVLDVREAKEFGAGHIVSAINVPESKLTERLKEIDHYRDQPVLLCCGTGMVAGRAGGALKKHGFSKLFALKGGIAAWQQENLPLTREK